MRLDEAVRDMVEKQGKRLVVSMNDLRDFDPDFARGCAHACARWRGHGARAGLPQSS